MSDQIRHQLMLPMPKPTEEIDLERGVVTSRMAFAKDCDCKGSSSGPRNAIVFEPFVPGESLKFRLVWSYIVCDECQKAWIFAEVADADRGE